MPAGSHQEHFSPPVFAGSAVRSRSAQGNTRFVRFIDGAARGLGHLISANLATPDLERGISGRSCLHRPLNCLYLASAHSRNGHNSSVKDHRLRSYRRSNIRRRHRALLPLAAKGRSRSAVALDAVQYRKSPALLRGFGEREPGCRQQMRHHGW